MEEAKLRREEMIGEPRKANLGGLSQIAGGPFTQLSDLHKYFACPSVSAAPRAGLV